MRYFTILNIKISQFLQYRQAAVAGMLTQLFFGMIRVCVFYAFYQQADDNIPMNFNEVIAYVWLGQIFFALLPYRVEPEIELKFRDGSIAYDFLKPIDFYRYWFAISLSYRLIPTLLRGMPLLLVLILSAPLLAFFGIDMINQFTLQFAKNTTYFAYFLVSILLAIGFSTALTVLMQISLFWTLSATGVTNSFNALMVLGTGLVLPLPLFPDKLQWLLEWQPFRCLFDIPFRLYSGNIPLNEANEALLFQLCWTLILIGFGQLLLKVAHRQLVVQGG